MKNKKNKATLKQGIIVFGIFFGLILIGLAFQLIIDLFKTPQFKIYLNETEVDKLIACCLDLQSINSFENISRGEDVGSIMVEKDPNLIYCSPKENLRYFEVPCEIIEKKDLTIEWLDWNAECVRINEPCEDLECGKGGRCIKYKFGDYFIELK